jgi:hypothetical protein
MCEILGCFCTLGAPYLGAYGHEIKGKASGESYPPAPSREFSPGLEDRPQIYTFELPNLLKVKEVFEIIDF